MIYSKKLLNKQLEILDVFIGISSGLMWWIDGKSLLEYFAKGKIPENISMLEIGIPRSDYETYLKRAKKVKKPYFNKSYGTDSFPCGYSRLMDLNTTALVLRDGEFYQKNKKQGMYISIYPFDNVVKDNNFTNWIKDLTNYKSKAYKYYILANSKINDIEIFEGWYSKFINCMTKYNKIRNTKYFANLSRVYDEFNDLREKKNYKELKEIDFFGRKIYVPKISEINKEELCKTVKQTENIEKVDPEKPYTNFLFNKKHLSDEEFLSTLNLKIDNEFLQDEVRWGYKVNKEMKKVWAVELDLINEFNRVCKKFGLQWWVDGGTMLGAIRHQGFIPWDDDVDVAMLRKDFDKILENHKEFKGKYFLQSFETDRFVTTKYRLMNLNTTAMGYTNFLSPVVRFQMTGFIDIFAFENIKDLEDWKQRNYSKIAYKVKASQFLKSFYLTQDSEALKQSIDNFELYKSITIGNYTKEETKLLADVTLTNCDDRFKRYSEDYKKTIYIPFEMLSVPCPKNWKRCLELQYGKNWRTPVKGTQYHSCWIYDNDNAYNDYVRYLSDLIK